MSFTKRIICSSYLFLNSTNHHIGSYRHLSLVPKQVKLFTNNLIKTLTIRPAKSDLPGFQSLPPYLVFRYSDAQNPTHSTKVVPSFKDRSFNLINNDKNEHVSKRPLVVVFTWMLSEQAHIEKYREFWRSRGFDCLTVQTSPTALLFPNVGGRYVAEDVFKFISQIRPRYDEILIHAFSVGGYTLGELLNLLRLEREKGNAQAEEVSFALKGMIIDSLVFSADAAPGLSRAITRHQIGQPLLETALSGFLSITKSFTMDRYLMLEAHFIDNKRHVPSMMLFSRDDVVSNFRTNFAVVTTWTENGITSRAKCWEKSGHVVHYRKHPKEYEQEVDDFVSRLAITKAPKRSSVNEVQLSDYGMEPFNDYAIKEM